MSLTVEQDLKPQLGMFTFCQLYSDLIISGTFSTLGYNFRQDYVEADVTRALNHMKAQGFLPETADQGNKITVLSWKYNV